MKYDLDTLVNDLSLLLDLARIEQAVLVGHGLGADVVSRYAGRHPERVTALVLIDPPGNLRAELAQLESELSKTDDTTFRAKVDALVEKLLVGARPDTRTAVLVRGTRRDVLQLMLTGMATFQPVHELAGYQGPLSCLVTDHTASRDTAARPCRTVERIHGVSPLADARRSGASEPGHRPRTAGTAVTRRRRKEHSASSGPKGRGGGSTCARSVWTSGRRAMF